ncbi:helix-turn-helix domain-containing protein [Winogradskyella luteola]|uniref:Helix-turn-helix domain-containing protein n=1 Tax=Winogradskyella luteola TaxID=2828330 RepID=A0A9X1F7M1_9FLAO|nr:helix-turn-helix domain-containing protein [Winogradskyella luteola]MBV7268709.1 helix-turn-helix domain-containing protein [Winogradskyella luteola]
MQHFTTLKDYCLGIGISEPKWQHFDVRMFQDNMKTVRHKMPTFKHEFYAIALKLDGSGYAKTGNFSTKNLKATVFFNSPYQILQWDIAPDWEGFYIIFSEEFYRSENKNKKISIDFPFLLIDNTIPLELDKQDVETFVKTFESIIAEHRANHSDAQQVVYHHTQILLHKVARLFQQKVTKTEQTFQQRDNDVALVSRFKNLIEISFYPDTFFDNAEPHKVQYYASKLAIHPNHLNAVVKRITDYSASELIYKHLLSLAKSKLKNTSASVKEIAFQLHYNYPNHFTNFFKKQTELTPNQFRNR